MVPVGRVDTGAGGGAGRSGPSYPLIASGVVPGVLAAAAAFLVQRPPASPAR